MQTNTAVYEIVMELMMSVCVCMCVTHIFCVGEMMMMIMGWYATSTNLHLDLMQDMKDISNNVLLWLSSNLLSRSLFLSPSNFSKPKDFEVSKMQLMVINEINNIKGMTTLYKIIKYLKPTY